MKRTAVILLMILFATSSGLFAQRTVRGNGNIVKTQTQLPPFNAIDADGADNIIITTHGTPYTVIIETDENLQDRITVTHRRNMLGFSYSNINPKKMNFYVTVPSLEMLKISGAADVKSVDTLKVKKIEIDASGAADLKLGLKGEEVHVDASGAADVRLSGKAQELYIEGSGAADVKAGKLIADSVFAKATGASTLYVNPVNYIRKKESGAADIKIISRTKKTVRVESSENPQRVIIYDEEVTDNYEGDADTTKVKLGSLRLEVIDGDTTKIKLGNHVLVVDDDGDVEWTRCKEPWFNGHWGGVELGINGYVTPDFNTDFGKKYEYLNLRYEKSATVNINLFEQNFGLNKAKTIGLVTGIGFSFNNYRFTQPVYLSPDSINLSGFYIRGTTVRKSKLTAAYVTVPLLFEVQTNNPSHGKRFHFSVGALLGARIGSHTKIYFNEANAKYRLEDPATGIIGFEYYTTPNRTNRNIVKSFNSFSLQPFRADAMFRIGYGAFNLFATYSLNPMFQKNKGPDLRHWTVGLTLVGW